LTRGEKVNVFLKVKTLVGIMEFICFLSREKPKHNKMLIDFWPAQKISIVLDVAGEVGPPF